MAKYRNILHVEIPSGLKERLRKIAKAEYRRFSDVVRLSLMETARQGHTPNADPPPAPPSA